MDDPDLTRHLDLCKICHVTRHGTVEGVEFDFRDEHLDPNEWGMHLLGSTIGLMQKSKRQPFIWFPWYEKFDEAQIIRDLKRSHARHGGKTTKNALARAVREYTPDAFVFEGDKLFITKLLIMTTQDPFAHLHDTERRYAFIGIKRKNGNILKLRTPVEFIGATSMLYYPASKRIFDNIANRIISNFNLDSINDPKADEIIDHDGLTFAEAALSSLKKILFQRRDEFANAQKLDIKDPQSHAAFALKQTIEQAVRVGYFWANAEAELRMEPFAKAGLNARKGAKKAGVVSGDKRRAKADATWKLHAMQLAKQLRQTNPRLSQHRLANEISFAWKPALLPQHACRLGRKALHDAGSV